MRVVCVLLVLSSCINIGLLEEHEIEAVNYENGCGTVASDGLQLLIINGTKGYRGEVPWHAGIYRKWRPYQQICGGSLISNTIIISAAHCFWDGYKDHPYPASYYAVAVGKLYRPWNDKMEKGQQSDVKEIHLPPNFQGSEAHFQDDIAVVIVTKPFTYKVYVRPVCIDFDYLFDSSQLQEGHSGKVAGWGLTEENGRASQVLKTISLPYVNVTTCIHESPRTFRGFITSDKICAGFKNAGTSLCEGDSGGGLAFARSEDGLKRYYLRGIASSAPTSDSRCNANAYTSFTWLLKHEHFIKNFWKPQDCILPPYPANGTYVTNEQNLHPGDAVDFIVLNVTCHENYRLNGPRIVTCYQGWWREPLPQCVCLTNIQPGDLVDFIVVNATSHQYSPNDKNLHPGDAVDFIVLNVTCHERYRLNGHPPVTIRSPAMHGWWREPLPHCVSVTLRFGAACEKKETRNSCSDNQLTCRDGSCIPLAHKCDGIVDCPDGSDETHALCWNNECPGDKFRCTYGACVNLTAPCNGVPACVDYSDELLPNCRNFNNTRATFKCFDGAEIEDEKRCDGWKDCKDGSDETLWTCVDMVCSSDQFQCAYGACIDIGLKCNNVKQCADGSDEAVELCETPVKDLGQWTCRDGSCIPFSGKCNGIVDCNDRSDETHALCRSTTCQHNMFRCTYGACVDVAAPCNGVKECADESDELLPRCRNETEEVSGLFKCLDGSSIPASNHCDGFKDCTDGSDETIRTCAAKTCPSNLFQCAYGACVDEGADCNKVQDCADGSDEALDLCAGPTTESSTPEPQGICVLPPYPNHGTYVTNKPGAKPGDGFDFITINVTCRQGYGVDGSNSVYCYNGWWAENVPRCIPQCRLKPHRSVEYLCLILRSSEGTRACKEYELTGTVVRPVCRGPAFRSGSYFTPNVLPDMRCINGNWDYVARCIPECGIVNEEAKRPSSDSISPTRGQIPWHAGIYSKVTEPPYKYICGGSLISNNIIISAAHCFFDESAYRIPPATDYAVAVGKQYRDWNDVRDDGYAQHSDVKIVNIPVRYQGLTANYQDDIAVVKVTMPFEYKTFVSPVCVDFDITFERRQLHEGRKGKLAVYQPNETSKIASPELQVIELPIVDISTCIRQSPDTFRSFLTSDKFCAGFKNGTQMTCLGDIGGGLALPDADKGTSRYYLRGVMSLEMNDDGQPDSHGCTTKKYYDLFTHVVKHEHFIQEFLGFESEDLPSEKTNEYTAKDDLRKVIEDKENIQDPSRDKDIHSALKDEVNIQDPSTDKDIHSALKDEENVQGPSSDKDIHSALKEEENKQDPSSDKEMHSALKNKDNLQDPTTKNDQQSIKMSALRNNSNNAHPQSNGVRKIATSCLCFITIILRSYIL